MVEQKIIMRKARINTVIALIIITLAVNSIIMLSPDADSKNYWGNILRPVTAVAATGLALIVIYRQKVSGVFGRAYAYLAAGLVSWLVAEIIWGYYSIQLGIEVPFPSPADAFWLAAYAPFGACLFSLSRLYSNRKNRTTIILVSIAVAIFSLYYIHDLVSVADLTDPEALVPLAISIAYPVLDGILIVPAVIAVLSSGKGYLTSVPWLFIGWIFFVIADALFGYTAVLNIAGDISIWNLFYNAGYLTTAAGLFWHNKYLILDKNMLSVPKSGA